MKTTQKRISKGYLFRVGDSKGVSHCHFGIDRVTKTGRRVEKLYCGKKGRLECALMKAVVLEKLWVV